MKTTRETVRRHLSPWVLIVWAALAGLASIVDRFDLAPPNYPEERRME